MRIPAFCLFTLATLSLVSSSYAQDPLDEMYGQAVHSYFRGDVYRAQELLNEVIGAGSQDPRAYFFRGICQSAGNAVVSHPDFERGAQLEIEGKKVVNVGKALERIQGPLRVEIEKTRSRARLASRARLLEIQRARYEEMQRSGGAPSGLVVPPRVDPAPAPSNLAPNDPFNAGMTKGDPKVTTPPTTTEEPTTDEFSPDTPMEEVPTETPADEDDPFK